MRQGFMLSLRRVSCNLMYALVPFTSLYSCCTSHHMHFFARPCGMYAVLARLPPGHELHMQAEFPHVVRGAPFVQFVKIVHKTSKNSCREFLLCLVLCFYDCGFWRKPKALAGSTHSPCSLCLFSIAPHPLAHFLRKGRGERKIYFE